MTIAESIGFVQELEQLAGDLLDAVDVVVCPSYTALWPVAQVLQESRLQLGAQNVAPVADLARTGEVSAALLADVGCHRVMLGHWETRRNLGDDDVSVNSKVHLALQAGLAPILLVGEARDEGGPTDVLLEARLARVLQGCKATQVQRMAFVYEPEGAIGVAEPITPEDVARGCCVMRNWLRKQWGETVADSVRIIYGGSVAPDHAAELLTVPDLDGLGASRKGRNPGAFVEILRQIAQVKRDA